MVGMYVVSSNQTGVEQVIAGERWKEHLMWSTFAFSNGSVIDSAVFFLTPTA